MGETAPTPPLSPTWSLRTTVLWLMSACVVCFLSYRLGLVMRAPEPQESSLPILATITDDLVATERNGTTVRLTSLRGKVFTCAYLYTVCPHGCSMVINQMKRLHKSFGTRPDFHQVSIAIDPERNTPEVLKSYGGGMGIYPTDPWWFITGDSLKLASFMERQIGLEPAKPIPPEERLNPLDLNKYDLRIALVDRQGRVRGRYDVFHPQPEVGQRMREQLQADTEFLLNNPNR